LQRKVLEKFRAEELAKVLLEKSLAGKDIKSSKQNFQEKLEN
jgi:hypothetical protein